MKKIFFTIIFLILTIFSTSLLAKSISIDYDDVDIRIVIKALSELIGKNFILDPEVSGKITVISPQRVSLNDVEKILETILNINGYTIVSAKNISKIIPLTKARQMNVPIFSGKQQQETTEKMITQLVYLNYANVEKVAKILNPLISTYGALSIYTPTNLLIVTDSASNIAKCLSILNKVDQKESQITTSNIVYLKNTDADKIATTLTTIYDEKKKKRRTTEGEEVPIIIPNKETNSLVIIAYPQEYNTIKEIIERLDIVQSQVLVEVLITEMTLNKTKELGLELAANQGIIYGTEAGFSGTATKGIIKNIATGGSLENNALGIIEGSQTIGDITVPDIGALISISQKDNDINILSAPQIVTSNHEEAKILVGKKLAFIKNSQVTAEGGTVKTFEFKDVGLILYLTPHINVDGFVRLKIKQEIEDVAGISFEGAVETTKRELVTQLTVKDNSTAILGGLITDVKRNQVNKIPLLGDVPLLGHFFKKTSTYSEKMNLLIFITPHILKTPQDLETLSQYSKPNVSHEKK